MASTSGFETLRVSNIESNINDVGDMVKMIAGGNPLTESQNSRLVAYLGDLGTMKEQLAVMIQHYEDNEKVLKRLIGLYESIDKTLVMIQNAQSGYQDGADEGSDSDEDNDEDSDKSPSNVTPQQQFTSLLTSSIVVTPSAMLVVSGIIDDPRSSTGKHAVGNGDNSDSDSESDSEVSDEESPWDPPITEQDLHLIDLQNMQVSQQVPLSLSVSVVMGEEQPQLVLAPTRSSEASVGSSSSNKGKKKVEVCDPVECKICCDVFTLESELYTLGCDHTYCKDCLGQLLLVMIQSGAVLDLTCPQPGCGREISPLEVSALVEADIYKKFEQFVILAALRTDPNVRWCPLPTCSSSIKGPPPEGIDWLVCGACGLNVCFKCGDERHDPAQCGKEAHELLAHRHSNFAEAQQAFDLWHEKVKEKVKKCPGCKAFIEKNQGCNHMTCKACKYQFCWLCTAKYESNHFSNSQQYPDCIGKQYWSPPIVALPDPELQKKYNWIYFPETYQYADVDKGSSSSGNSNTSRAKAAKRAKKIGVYVGVGVAVATLGVPAAIIGGPIYGVFKLHKRLKAKRNNKNSSNLY